MTTAHDEQVAKRSFELSTTVPGAPTDVIDFLMDLDKHRGLHPYLVSAKKVTAGVSHRGPWFDWHVVERPALGPLRYRVRFRARLTRMSDTSMEARVWAAPGCHLRGVTRAESLADGRTLLTECVVATAPLPVVRYLARQARAAHAQTFARLSETLVG